MMHIEKLFRLESNPISSDAGKHYVDEKLVSVHVSCELAEVLGF